MSGYDCLNRKRFTSRRKVDSEIAATSTFVYSTMYVQFVEKNKIPRQGTPPEITWKWGDSVPLRPTALYSRCLHARRQDFEPRKNVVFSTSTGANHYTPLANRRNPAKAVFTTDELN